MHGQALACAQRSLHWLGADLAQYLVARISPRTAHITRITHITHNMHDITLYDYARSSASYRVRIALHLAGIDHDAVAVNLLDSEHRSEAHLARNPQGLVPVLEVDGHQLTQSLAIIEYLDETRSLGLLPSEPVARAKVRALAHIVAIDVHPVCNLSVVKHATGGEEPARSDWMRHFIEPGLRAFEATLASFEQNPFCTGAEPSLADICLMPQLYNADRWGASRENFTRINRVAEACAEHPAFKAAHPEAAERP